MTTTRGRDDGAWKIGPAGRQGGDERRQLSEFERSSHICSGEEIRSRSWDGGGSKAFPRRYRCAWRHAARIRIAWILVVFATLDVAAPIGIADLRPPWSSVWIRAAATDSRPNNRPSAGESAGQSAVAGAVAGFTARVAVAPIDLAKIRLQLQQTTKGVGEVKYRGMLQTMRRVAKEEGVLALWKGNVPAQLMVMTFVSVKFASYSWLRDALNTRDKAGLAAGQSQSGTSRTLINLMAGGLAGAAATVTTYPFDLLRTRLASRSTGGMRNALYDETIKVWSGSGALGFYKGLGPSLISIVPYMAIQLSSFEAAKAVYLAVVSRGAAAEQTQLGLVPSTALGAAAGGLSKILTLPLDLCKKRMQMNMVQDKYVPQILARIVREEGFLALWKGGVPAVIKTVPATAITFGVYEVVKAAQMRRFEARQTAASAAEEAEAAR